MIYKCFQCKKDIVGRRYRLLSIYDADYKEYFLCSSCWDNNKAKRTHDTDYQIADTIYWWGKDKGSLFGECVASVISAVMIAYLKCCIFLLSIRNSFYRFIDSLDL